MPITRGLNKHIMVREHEVRRGTNSHHGWISALFLVKEASTDEYRPHDVMCGALGKARVCWQKADLWLPGCGGLLPTEGWRESPGSWSWCSDRTVRIRQNPAPSSLHAAPCPVCSVGRSTAYADYSKGTKPGKAHGKNQPIYYFFWKFYELGILGTRIVFLSHKKAKSLMFFCDNGSISLHFLYVYHLRCRIHKFNYWSGIL